MYLNVLKRAVTISCFSLSGASLYYLLNTEKLKTVHNFSSTNFKPSCEWDSNWDFRAPTSLVKPISENASAEKQNEYNEKLEKHSPKAIRNIILIRHGQYEITALEDKGRILTKLGREQAKFTGQRLKDLQIPIDEMIVSTMTRAQETGKIILNQLPNVDKIKVNDCKMIEEGAVIKPIPEIHFWNPDDCEFFVDGARIEAAFRRYVHRAEPSQEKDSYTVLVCHGNVIRYFVCRALQLPPEAWLRFNLHHASITQLSVFPNGRVVARLYGDCGFMPKSHVTLS